MLDVGCGTGRLSALLAERGAKVWGIDPSAEMLAEARRRLPRGVGLKQGQAEALPFRRDWFERAVLWLSVHLVERDRTFRELDRVLGPGGRVVLATFPTNSFGRSWPARFFPSLAPIDRARFPEPEALANELRAASFPALRTRTLSQTRLGGARRRAREDPGAATSRRSPSCRRTSTATGWRAPSASWPTSRTTRSTG